MNNCLKMLRALEGQHFLEEEYVRMVEGKVGILNLPYRKRHHVLGGKSIDEEVKGSPYIFDLEFCRLGEQKYIESFKDKQYSFLLQGYVAFYRGKDWVEAQKLFHQAAELGSEEATVMEAICEQKKKGGIPARNTMDDLEKTIRCLGALAIQMVDEKSTIAHEDELIVFFNAFAFNANVLKKCFDR